VHLMGVHLMGVVCLEAFRFFNLEFLGGRYAHRNPFRDHAECATLCTIKA
jgi:hypothetical protein